MMEDEYYDYHDPDLARPYVYDPDDVEEDGPPEWDTE